MPTYLASRRAVLLRVLPAVALALVARRATADEPEVAAAQVAASPPRVGSRVVRSSRDGRGVTLVLELEHAPFPAPGAVYRDPTVVVFVPHHFRPGPGDAIGILVHFHGHNSTAERAMVAHELREQLFDSKQNAILVVPELAVLAPDSAVEL
jgi:hypothetical protein